MSSSRAIQSSAKLLVGASLMAMPQYTPGLMTSSLTSVVMFATAYAPDLLGDMTPWRDDTMDDEVLPDDSQDDIFGG